MFAHGETVVRLRALRTLNEYSGQLDKLSWTEPDELPIPGCGVDPGGSNEPLQDGRGAVVTTPTIYAPAGADVHADDRLTVRGTTYAVDGTPAVWRNPVTGWAPGVVIKLKDVEG